VGRTFENGISLLVWKFIEWEYSSFSIFPSIIASVRTPVQPIFWSTQNFPMFLLTYKNVFICITTSWKAQYPCLSLNFEVDLEWLSLGSNKFNNSLDLSTITITSKGLEVEVVKIFTTIDFSCNNFVGPMPEGIGEFTLLYILNLSHNDSTSQIQHL
jgi:hypothetical protein